MGKTQHKIHYPFLPWLIWIVASLFLAYDYIQQMAPNAMEHELIQGLHITRNAAYVFGSIAAVYYYSYALMQLPGGIILDHFGPHRPLFVAVLVASLGSIFFGWTQTAMQAETLRFIIGGVTAFSFIGALKLISNWFSTSLFATLTGLTNLVGNVGAIGGETPIAYLVNDVGWRTTWLIIGILGIILSVLILVIVRDHPKHKIPWEKQKPANKRGLRKLSQDIIHVFASGQIWMMGIYAGVLNMSFTAFGAAWGTSYIVAEYGVSKVTASLAVTMLFIGGIPGSFFFGWFSDWLKQRKLPLIMGALGALIVMLLILYLPFIPLSAEYVLFAVLGFFCSSLVVAFSLAHDLSPPGSAGIALGFINAWCMGGSAISPPLIGWLLDEMVPVHATVTGSVTFSAQDYQTAFLLVVGALFIGLILSLVTRETHCRKQATS